MPITALRQAVERRNLRRASFVAPRFPGGVRQTGRAECCVSADDGASPGCTCRNQVQNILVSAVQASYPTLGQVIWYMMHNQTDAT